MGKRDTGQMLQARSYSSAQDTGVALGRVREKQWKKQRRKRRIRRLVLLVAAAGCVWAYQNSSRTSIEAYLPIYSGDVVYYSQLDKRWGDLSYGQSGTIAEAGCGPSCLAMVASTLTDQQITPSDAAGWAVQNGQRCEGNGSYHSIIPAGGQEYGFSVQGVGKDKKAVQNALKDGKLIVALMSKGHFTKSGHFILLRGLSESGKVLVCDPMSKMRSWRQWELDLIVREAKAGASDGGPFWICWRPDTDK